MPLSNSSPVRTARLLALVIIVALLRPTPASAQEPSDAGKPFAVTPVTVIDVEEGDLLPNQTVVVTGNRIAAVGPAASVEVPDDARVVDGTGKYLIPGLWDMHVHALFDPAFADGLLALLVANGVTGIRDMGGRLDVLADARDRSRAGALLTPRIAAAGPILDGPEPGNPRVSWPIATAEEGRAAVDSLARVEVDFVKVYTLLPREAFFAITERARERGLPVAGHVPASVTPAEAARAGMRSVEHLRSEIEPFCTRSTPAACDSVFTAFRAEDTWQTPTLGVRRNRAFLDDSAAVWRPHLRWGPRPLLEEWRGIRAGRLERGQAYFDRARERHADEVYVTGRLNEAGLPILAGSDAGALFQLHGFALHDELELLVRAGLPPLEALRSATLGPARFLRAADSLGTIEEGKRADLVLLEANPLEDINHTREIAAVVVDGRYLDRDALDQLLAEAERAASGRSSNGESEGETVRVAPPTGEKETDRANVQAAFNAVEPKVRPQAGVSVTVSVDPCRLRLRSGLTLQIAGSGI